MKIKIHALIIFLFSALFFCACKKNDLGVDLPAELPDFSTRITASASGFVTDENDLPVAGALVKMGTGTTTTDEFGFFQFRNGQVVKNAGVITVTRSGYFTGTRTFTAEEDKEAFVRIKLSPKNIIGTIDATIGGIAANAEGLSVSLPVNGVVDASTGAPYTGMVTVSARWLNPATPDILHTMPGDLRAIDANGSLRLLITYGMAAVELTGFGGQQLQIASGKKSLLTFPMPASMLANSPNTIPLWHFDEEKGLWIEEGYALKNGNTFSGEVSHFSFWNLDIPTQVVNFQARLKDQAGTPVSGAFVKIYKRDDPMNLGTGFTNSSGYVSGGIPANADLVFEVYSNIQCTEVAYTQNITSGSSTFNFGDVVLPGQSLAKVHGRVENCGYAPIQSGFVIMTLSGHNYRYELDSTSTFSFAAPLCGNNGQASIIAVDRTTMQQSEALTFPIAAGDNQVNSLRACGISALEFVQVNFRDTTYMITSPPDSFFVGGLPTANLLRVQTAHMVDSVYHISSFIFMDRLGMAPGSSHVLYDAWFDFDAYLPPGSTTGNKSPVTITECGAIGEFISGYFSYDVLTAEGSLFGKMYYTFRFRRTF